MRPTPHSAVVFDDAATVMVALARNGDHLQALTNDPQVCFTPSHPIPAGWCQLVLEVEGKVSNPRVYLDFGEGPLEASSVALEWSESCRHLYADFGVDYESYALGSLADRCFVIPLRSKGSP